MKSYTEIEQGKNLVKILSLESADMYYQYVLPKSDKIKHNPEIGNPINALEWYNKGYVFSGKEPITMDEFCVPCWSLTALLSVLPNYQLQTQDDGIGILCSCNGKLNIITAHNPIDACVEMIMRLNELKML